MLQLRNSNDPFLDYVMIRNGSFPIVSDWLNGWIKTKHPNTFQNQNCAHRRLRWLSGGPFNIGVIHYSVLESTAEICSQKLDEMHIQFNKTCLALVNWRDLILLHAGWLHRSNVILIGIQDFATFTIFLWFLVHWLPLFQVTIFFQAKRHSIIKMQKLISWHSNLFSFIVKAEMYRYSGFIFWHLNPV